MFGGTQMLETLPRGICSKGSHAWRMQFLLKPDHFSMGEIQTLFIIRASKSSGEHGGGPCLGSQTQDPVGRGSGGP